MSRDLTGRTDKTVASRISIATPLSLGPNKLARSTVQVASLASATALVEIDVIAARSKAEP
jgi:enamine deaminase RidA (YjgF/YER057c/UK114 family)